MGAADWTGYGSGSGWVLNFWVSVFGLRFVFWCLGWWLRSWRLDLSYVSLCINEFKLFTKSLSISSSPALGLYLWSMFFPKVSIFPFSCLKILLVIVFECPQSKREPLVHLSVSGCERFCFQFLLFS